MQVRFDKNYEVKARIALKIWLEANNISVRMLSKKLEVNQSGVWRWYNGETFPHLLIALKLEEFTQGAVPCSLWKPTPIESTKKKVKSAHGDKPYSSKSQETKKHTSTISKGSR